MQSCRMSIFNAKKTHLTENSKKHNHNKFTAILAAILIGIAPLLGVATNSTQVSAATSSLPSLPDPEENTARTNYPVPAGVTGVWVTLIGAGGGGGGGADGNSGVRTGGGGGGGGAVIQKAFIPVSQLGSTYSVSIGTGGAGGNGAVTAGNGLSGTAGGASVFSSGTASVSAGGGGGGGFGTLWFEGSKGAAGTATVKNVSGVESFSGSTGGIGSNAFGAAGNAGNNTGGGAAGGGGGGGIGIFGDVYAGGAGGNSVTATGGAAAAKNTANTGSSATPSITGYPGAGGGAGSALLNGRGGAGGDGSTYGGGGGGGAGGLDANNGGAGAGGYTLIEWTPTRTVFLMAGNAGDPNLIHVYMKDQVTKGQVLVPITYPNMKKDTDNDMLAAAAILNDKLLATPGKKVVFTHSLGSVAATVWLKEYGPTSTIDPSELEFVLLGNSARKYNSYYTLHDWKEADGTPFVSQSHVAPISDTRYKVRDIVVQYDGWADWPDRATPAIATSNADFGRLLYHLSYDQYPLDRYDYRKYQEGNITYTLIPVNQWWSSAATMQTIESAYSRPEQ